MSWNRIKYFKPSEFDGKKLENNEWVKLENSGRDNMDIVSVAKLDILRSLWGKPLRCTSGFRTPEHNKAVGGRGNSAHLKGRAFDIHVLKHEQDAFAELAQKCGFTGVGFYETWVHIDDMTPEEGYARPSVWFNRRKLPK